MMLRLIAPFAIWIKMRKISYCNMNVIPLLKEDGIDWDMNETRIKFRGRTFLMKDIENGEAEVFIMSMRSEEQSVLDYWL